MNEKNYSKTKVIITAALIVALIGSGIAFATTQKEKSEELVVQGSLKMKEATLNSKLAGTINEVLVEEGETVKAGDPLLSLTSETIEAKLQQAEGAKAAAEAQADKAAAGARNQEVAQAKAAFDYAQKTYNRMKILLEQEAISQATFDQVEAQYTAAKETYNMAMEGARQEDKAAANALVKQAGGAVAEVNSYLEDSVIKAPMDGVVTSINVDPGELISTGMPLAAVTSPENPWVEVNVKETDLAKVHLGNEVELTFPAFPGETFKGKIVNVNKKPDFATKRATNENGDFDVLSYGVKVNVLDIDQELYSGMTVLVHFGKNEGK
ncbi:HlyD family secretion protein [Sinanaerobacter chloroacetimidivorans]|uniref:Efflux RND transporter periplasmic adaptor subunit n=1 Tax=Sinanaerobacter chloroacetimidivorans TaxID=2818044 RepID=A0A8J8B2J8_9FIRM|nr:efflux RND transporter periplasmic adaptor subunit [Sinanaerobacter chloroacetimidivorans]MBR0599379.1 efflux RND transporter periplasmic adaptor subunit [Sinanaerobacter chloroacetimidivorans]